MAVVSLKLETDNKLFRYAATRSSTGEFNKVREHFADWNWILFLLISTMESDPFPPLWISGQYLIKLSIMIRAKLLPGVHVYLFASPRLSRSLSPSPIPQHPRSPEENIRNLVAHSRRSWMAMKMRGWNRCALNKNVMKRVEDDEDKSETYGWCRGGKRRFSCDEENPNLHPENCRPIKRICVVLGFLDDELGQLTGQNFLFS